jgi:uncharacterized protein (TIGR00730 family)
MPNLCVFCGSRPGNHLTYAHHAQAVGEAIAAAGAGLVYGGGSVGLMGMVAEAAFSHGAPVYGVIPGGLFEREVGRERCTELFVVGSMHERKAKMVELADAFLALPGGAGTLDELFEIFTWRQIGIHQMPVGLLNSEGFYDGLLQHLATATAEGFVTEADRDRLLVQTDPAAAVRHLLQVAGEG